MWAASRRGQDDPVKLVSSDIISGFFYFSIYSYVLYRVAYKLTQPWKQRPISKQFNLILHCEFFVVSTSQRSPENNLNVNMRMLPDRQLTLSQLTDTFVQCFQIKFLVVSFFCFVLTVLYDEIKLWNGLDNFVLFLVKIVEMYACYDQCCGARAALMRFF